MTKIGNAYYCQTNFINLGFWHELNPWNWVSFCIPNLCIQVPTQNTVTTTAEGRSAFVSTFREELKKKFDVALVNVSVNQNTCNNDCQIANYGVNIVGSKASPGECVYDEN